MHARAYIQPSETHLTTVLTSSPPPPNSIRNSGPGDLCPLFCPSYSLGDLRRKPMEGGDQVGGVREGQHRGKWIEGGMPQKPTEQRTAEEGDGNNTESLKRKQAFRKGGWIQRERRRREDVTEAFVILRPWACVRSHMKTSFELHISCLYLFMCHSMVVGCCARDYSNSWPLGFTE